MNNDNEDMDPFEAFKQPKNKTPPRMRHLALNADGLMFVREHAETIDHLDNDVSLKMALIAFMMYNAEDDEDESISDSSSSTSPMVFRKYSSDSISESDSILHMKTTVIVIAHLLVMKTVTRMKKFW